MCFVREAVILTLCCLLQAEIRSILQEAVGVTTSLSFFFYNFYFSVPPDVDSSGISGNLTVPPGTKKRFYTTLLLHVTTYVCYFVRRREMWHFPDRKKKLWTRQTGEAKQYLCDPKQLQLWLFKPWRAPNSPCRYQDQGVKVDPLMLFFFSLTESTNHYWWGRKTTTSFCIFPALQLLCGQRDVYRAAAFHRD